MSEKRLGQTPWQTTGPFFQLGVPWKGCADLTGNSEIGARADLCAPGHDMLFKPDTSGRHLIEGKRITIVGRITENTGAPYKDVMLEIWQANAAGRYAHPEDQRNELPLDPNFIGFGRCAANNGEYRIHTIRPGRVPGPGNTLQAPHIAFGLLGPAIQQRLLTRLYFSDAPENADDPILALVPADRRSTLIAVPEPGAPDTYRFDIHLGGPNEIVFFEF